MAEAIEMLLGWVTQGRRNHVLDGDPDSQEEWAFLRVVQCMQQSYQERIIATGTALDWLVLH